MHDEVYSYRAARVGVLCSPQLSKWGCLSTPTSAPVHALIIMAQRRSDTINFCDPLMEFLYTCVIRDTFHMIKSWRSCGHVDCWTMDMAGVQNSGVDKGQWQDYDSSNSSPRAKTGDHELEDGSYVLHLLSVGDIVKYTTPIFRFITVDLQHFVVSDRIESDD